MNQLWQWATFLLIGIGTFALRLSLIEFYSSLRIPFWFSRAMAYVPASVLAALVLPAVMYQQRHTELDWSNPQIPAAILAGVVAWFTRSTMLTLGVGMGGVWALMTWGV